MHGGRQFVPWGVLLSEITNETPAPSCHPDLPVRGETGGTAGAKPEEGGGNGTSVCPESPGLHARYKGRDNGCGDPERGS